MIYICADDYGLCDVSSFHIKQCIDRGALNKVSVFPNFVDCDFTELFEKKDLCVSLHVNLVEGKCMANPHEIGLLADANGNLKHTFGGLLKLSLLKRKQLEEQIYEEVKAQISYWKSILPQDAPFSIDSHQHTHMIPVIFKVLLKVLADENINIQHMRIPAEPFLPYLKTPSLYFTYSVINIIKQWLLNFLWLLNKPIAKKQNIPTAHFMGILFSGKMDEKRVNKILPGYIKIAEKTGMNIEVLFHPGYLDSIADIQNKNIPFKDFYISENRKIEFDTLMQTIRERSM
ncbi:MAG: ChbG/HpnK family deacetylase [Clostridia bacterium]|nr:ChbG/HpnK family deacetylase [Clostridia bacterium]